MNPLRTAVIGVGHLGKHHARLHAILAREERTQFVAICDVSEAAQELANNYAVEFTNDWRTLINRVDAVSLAAPTETHCEMACGLLEAGIHVLVEKPIARTLDEADMMIRASRASGAVLQVGHLERFNPAMVALRPYVKSPLYFEIHRIGQFTARSLDIDVVLDLMIHDLDIVSWLVGAEVEVVDVRAVGIPVLTNRVDASNVRLEFANGAVANITASRIGTEKIRKMRFFQPHDFVAIDYVTNYAAISSLVPSDPAQTMTDMTPSPQMMANIAASAVPKQFPGVNMRRLDVKDVEPLRAEIESFINAIENKTPIAVTGEDGRRALSLALRALERIEEHAMRAGLHKIAEQTIKTPR
ncbi:MAG: Gfo/Idh/MocA family oxidoreductase [Pyrinomonadaceae bacterium]